MVEYRRDMQFKENETIFSQIEQLVKKKIFTGEYSPGERLPAIREFAVMMKVNPNTIVKVYSDLEQVGLIVSERTNGKFVTEDTELIRLKKTDFIHCEIKELLENLKDMTEGEEEIVKHIKEHYENV